MKPPKLHLLTLALSASVLFAGACTQDLSQDNTKPGSKLTQLSNGPDLPEECNVCWDDFQDCFAEGNDVEACGNNIVDCTDECQAPPPPDACLHCAAGFDACANAAADNGSTGGDCAAGFEGCLFACQSDCTNSAQGCGQCDPGDNGTGQDGQDPGDGSGQDGTDAGNDPTEPGNDLCQPIEPPTDECGQCDQAFNECFDDLWQDESNTDAGQTPEICDELLFDCFDNCNGGGDGGDGGGNDCEQAVDECLSGDSPNGQEDCAIILDQCDSTLPPNGDDGSTPPDQDPDNTPPGGQGW
jgi:hypothetical protein